MGFIYLIQLSKFKNINVYKVGMTESRKIKDRLNGYGKLGIDYFVEYYQNIDTARDLESKIIKKFNEHFLLYEGKEWFMGNCNEMINIIKDEYKRFIHYENSILSSYDMERTIKQYDLIKKKYKKHGEKNTPKHSVEYNVFDTHDKDWQEDLLESIFEVFDVANGNADNSPLFTYVEREYYFNPELLKLQLKLFEEFIKVENLY